METVTLLQVLDKYGPLAVALVVVCFVLVLFVRSVLPTIIESYGKRLDDIIHSSHERMDAIVASFKNAMALLDTRISDHEKIAAERHDEIMVRFDRLDKHQPPRDLIP